MDFKGYNFEPVHFFSNREHENFIDYSSWDISPVILEGVSSKILVENSNKKVILKFGKYNEHAGNIVKDYLSEYLSCGIATILGYDTQSVNLGYFNGRECAAIDYFGYIPISFKGLGYSTLSGEKLHTRDLKYDLDWLLGLKMNPAKFGITQMEYESWVLDVFLLDMFVGNYDRHEGNWGFKLENRLRYPSPLYDMGASLFIREMDRVANYTTGELKHMIETDIRSSVLFKGKKRSYFRLLEEYIQNPLFALRFRLFMQLVEANLDKFGNLYETVRRFNAGYSSYVDFVDRLLRLKYKELRRFL